jgi:hypothetical protein
MLCIAYNYNVRLSFLCYVLHTIIMYEYIGLCMYVCYNRLGGCHLLSPSVILQLALCHLVSFSEIFIVVTSLWKGGCKGWPPTEYRKRKINLGSQPERMMASSQGGVNGLSDAVWRRKWMTDYDDTWFIHSHCNDTYVRFSYCNVVTGFLRYFQKRAAALVSVCYFQKTKIKCVVRFRE